MTGIALEQQQRQQLGLECRQGIALLGMTSLELDEYLRDCRDSNPFLKESEGSNRRHPLDFGRVQHVSVDGLRTRYGKKGSFARRNCENNEALYGSYERGLEDTPTLYDYLYSLCRQTFSDARDIDIADFLSGNIDSNGYLCCSLAEAAQECSCSQTRASWVLRVLQSVVVAGIGARDLRECLMLQLVALADAGAIRVAAGTGAARDSGIGNTPSGPFALAAAKKPDVADATVASIATDRSACIRLAGRILSAHLDDLAQGSFEKIAHALGVSSMDVQKAVDLIRELDPRPGRYFTQKIEATIQPEVFVERDAQGDFVVSLCEFALPTLVIDDTYISLLQDRKANTVTKRYMQREYRAATGLLKAVEQRSLHTRDIAVAIVCRQLTFFEFGPTHLVPMTMAQVAADTGLAESTVSRVVNGIWMQTPCGLFEMRSLFSAFVGAATGGGGKQEAASSATFAYSQASMLCMLKGLIEEEDPSTPHSDSELARLLQEKTGVGIARRTVSKYRARLSIPIHTLRRRFT